MLFCLSSSSDYIVDPSDKLDNQLQHHVAESTNLLTLEPVSVQLDVYSLVKTEDRQRRVNAARGAAETHRNGGENFLFFLLSN